jgi:subfamily B ATP-binding cassette protein MsbA
VGLVLLLSVGAALLSTLPPQVIGVAVDSLRPAEVMPGGNPQAQLQLAGPLQEVAVWVSDRWGGAVHPALLQYGAFGAVFLLLCLLSGLFQAAQQILMARVGQRLTYDMRGQVYRHLQGLSLSYFENNRTGDLMSRVVNDVNSLDQVIVGPVVGFLTDLFRLAWVLYFCLTWDWMLTLSALAVGPLLILVTTLFGRVMRKEFRRLRTLIGDLNVIANDNISGIRVIKVFSREDHEAERFDEKNRGVYEQNLRLAGLFAGFRPLVEFLTRAGSAVVLCVGGYQVVTGSMSPGMFVVFFTYLGMLYGPLTGLTRFWAFIQRAVASVERVFEVLDTEPAVKERPDARSLGALRGEVAFQDVRFAYENGPEVLGGISLQVSPGEMVALVGPSGAGKSTLIHLILRFYDCTSGRIQVDGHDVNGLQVRSLRRQMAMVQQDPFLFNDTIRANIGYGRAGADDRGIEDAARAANAHQFIASLDKGYDTVVGERGIKLSGGQKQRISIARAVLADPKILILDEATSSVDSESETLIREAIDRLAGDRTTFVIAHRLSTVLHADQILVMEDGRVVDRGRHADLLARGGVYERLYRLQFRDAPA